MSAVLPVRKTSKLRERLRAIDMRAVVRWVYVHRKAVGLAWLTVGLLLTAAVLAALWHIGGSAEMPAQTVQGPFGPLRTPAQAATPGLGHYLVTRWWGWLALAIFVPVFAVLSPMLLVGLPLSVFGSAVALAFLPLTLGAGLVVGPLLLIVKAPLGFISEMLEAIGLADGARGILARLRNTLGLTNAPRRGAEGQAVAMNQEDFARYEAKFKPSNGAPVHLGLFQGQPLSVTTDKHLLLLAPTRAGKGRDLIIPNLRVYPGSVFVLDPKGENAMATAEQRAAFGPVAVLDPFGLTRIPTSCWNPLALLQGENMVPAAQMLADALVVGQSDDHWTSSARQLLTGLLLHIATAPDMATRDLPTLRRLLTTELPATLEAMATNEDGPEAVRSVAGWSLGANEKEFAGIVSTAATETKWLDAPQMRAVLNDGGSQVDFGQYVDAQLSVFVVLPAPYFGVYNRWLRMLTAAAIDTMTSRLVKPPLPVRFILDELAQLGHLEKVESALTLSAGYGVQLWGVWQHLKDIERCYPRSGVGGWMSCTGARLVMNASDNETVKYITEACAGALSEADVRQFPPTHYLALIDGENPIYVERVPGPGPR